MSWRDDLPDIPADRIRDRVVGEGRRRRSAAAERRSRFLTRAAVAASLVVLVGGIALLDDRDPGGDASDDAAADTEAAAGTIAVTDETAAEATTAGTIAFGDTTAGTTGASEAAATTAAASATTAARPVPIEDVRAEPATVWELPESGEPCGPTELTVTASVVGAPTVTVVVRTAGGLRVEQPMTIVAGIATATFAGFPAGTVGPGEVESLRLQLLVTDQSGTIQVRGPTVELRDCTP